MSSTKRTPPFATKEDFEFIDKKMGLFDKDLPDDFNIVKKKV